MSPKQQRALNLYLKSHGLKLMLQRPTFTYETVDLRVKATGAKVSVPMDEIVNEYEANLKEQRKIRSAQRRQSSEGATT